MHLAKTQNSTPKRVNFIMCTLYLNKLAFKKKKLFGTESLFVASTYCVLYNSFSKMYIGFFKVIFFF